MSRTPPPPATDEREAVAVAALINALKQAGGYPATISHLKSGKFSDSISVHIAIAAIMDARAAEILAAEENERARIVAWLRTDDGARLARMGACVSHLERGEHKPKCTLCDGTGYKDHAGFAMDACNHEGAA